MCLCGLIAYRPLWRVLAVLCPVVCAFAVLLSLSLCSHACIFRPCWLFACSLVFLCGCLAFVRSVAKFKPLAVAVFFPRGVLRSAIRSGVAPLPSVAVSF